MTGCVLTGAHGKSTCLPTSLATAVTMKADDSWKMQAAGGLKTLAFFTGIKCISLLLSAKKSDDEIRAEQGGAVGEEALVGLDYYGNSGLI